MWTHRLFELNSYYLYQKSDRHHHFDKPVGTDTNNRMDRQYIVCVGYAIHACMVCAACTMDSQIGSLTAQPPPAEHMLSQGT